MTTPTPTLPEALRLADELDAEAGRITQYTNRPGDLLRELAADELRRMHSEVTTLQAELAAMRAGGEPVATIYVTPDGAREMDDWGVPLPEGATTLYTHPQPAAQDADPLQGAANWLAWLAQAHGQFCVAVLQDRLMIGYNRAKRLHDASIAARKQGGA